MGSTDDAARAHESTIRILYVARDADAASALRATLRDAGFIDVETVLDGRRALPAFREIRPDVVLLDHEIEGYDATAVAGQLGSRAAPEEFMPIVVLAGTSDALTFRAATDKAVPVFFRDASDAEGVALLVRELAAVRGNGRLIAESMARRFARARRVEAEAAHHLALFAAMKDHPDSGHVSRVGQFSAEVAKRMGFDAERVDLMRLAAPLHDVGKTAIPDSILNKESPLTLDELDIVKTHTAKGAALLAGSTSPLFQMAEEIALYHHENWDGTGYTPGLETDEIPLVGRIVRVVDSFDAITSSRPFAERWHRQHALDFIRGQAGRSFDPNVVECFLDVLDETGSTEAVDLLARGAF